ncbi:hypothetical protein OIU84_008814 [Salix udensis]|uniref:Superoxide dismutase copper/zinc binding domain-containing protein n=1 Tax=Salix udensis TaxID=889485 RepID=A0AAD6JQP6_9ROSI|nr:hypothetical protein OIU84_008814 [Salix udensis]
MMLLIDIDEPNSHQTCTSAFPNGKDELMNFEVTIRPDEGYYLGGTFVFSFQISSIYPHEAPKVKCKTKDHGAPVTTNVIFGDLGNIIARLGCGVAEVSIKDLQIPLSGMHSILGRAVVMHADPDDLGMVLLLSVWFDWVCIRVNCSFLCCSRFRALIN